MAWTGKKSVRILGTLIAVILLLLVAIKIFLPAEKIRDLALEQARQKLGRQVSVGQVGVSFRGGLGIRLADFIIPNPEGFAGEPLLSTKTLDLKLEISPLFKKEIRVNRLVIDSPRISLLTLADGRNNFTFETPETKAESEENPGSDSSGQAPPSLSIASLSINQGQISFHDAAAQEPALQKLVLQDLNLKMSLTDNADQVYRATGRITTGSIQITGPPQVPELDAGIDFSLSWDNSAARLAIEQADVQLLDLALACGGALELKESAPTGNIQIQMAEQPLNNLVKFLPAEVGSKLPDLKDHGFLNGTIDLELTGNKDQPFSASGKIGAKNIDLSLAQPFLPPEQKGQLSGQCDGELSFSNLTSDQTSVNYQGTLKARHTAFTESGLVDELENLDSTVEFDNNSIQIKSCRAQFASGTFFLTGKLIDPFPYFLPPEMQPSGTIKTPHLVFVLNTPRLDVDRLLPAASPGGPVEFSGQKKAPPRPGPDQEFPELTCTGTFAADSLIYMQVPLTQVTGKVELKDRLLRVYQVQGEVYQGTVGGDVAIDLNNLSDPQYSGSYQAQAIEVNHFVSRFAGLTDVLFGQCNLDGQFSTHGLDPNLIRNSLTLESAADLKQGRLVTSGNVHQTLNKLANQAGQSLDQEQNLSDLATHIKVLGGRVGLEEVTTRLGQFGDLSFSGFYAFTGGLDYQGKILLTEAETTRMFTHGGLLKELDKLLGEQRPSRLELPLTVGGIRSNPKIKIDFGSVVEDLQDRVVQQQGQRLEDEAKSKVQDLLNKWK